MATKKATLGDYYRRLKHLSANWKELGVLLDLKMSELRVIEKDNQKDSKDCMIGMLDAWMKSDPKNPEVQLDDALRELQCNVPHGKKDFVACKS